MRRPAPEAAVAEAALLERLAHPRVVRVYAALLTEVGPRRLYRLHPPALLTALWPLLGGPGGAWLLRIYDFLWHLGRAEPPALALRRAEWVEQIIRSQQADPVDEVVLVTVSAVQSLSAARMAATPSTAVASRAPL